MQPLTPISAAARLALGAAFFALFVGAWAAATYGGLVPPLFLASPGKTLAAGWSLLTEFGFLGDIAMTVWRVVGGFLIAAAIGVPLGWRWAPSSRWRPSSPSPATCRPAPSSRC